MANNKNMSYSVRDAFREFDVLTEAEEFELKDEDQLKAMDKFLNDEEDEQEQEEVIVDLEAETEDEIKDSYIGNFILECPVCKTKFYKNPDEVVRDEESELVNQEEECPLCGNTTGFNLIGRVAPVEEVKEEETEEEVKEEPVKEPEEEPVEGEEEVKAEEEEEVKESLNEDLRSDYQQAYEKWKAACDEVAEYKIPLAQAQTSDGRTVNQPDFEAVAEKDREAAKKAYEKYEQATKELKVAQNRYFANESLNEEVKDERLQILKAKLEDAKAKLEERGIKLDNSEKLNFAALKSYEIKFQDAIEEVFPDKCWWQMTQYWDIFQYLLSGKTADETIQGILDHIDIKQAEIKEAVEEAAKYTFNLMGEEDDWGEAFEDAKAHDGQVCEITGVAVQNDEDIFEENYYDIKFEDGTELLAVDGCQLSPLANEGCGKKLNEKLDEEAYDSLQHELYRAISTVAEKYIKKGLTFEDLDGALEFIEVHIKDDDVFFNIKDESLKEGAKFSPKFTLSFDSEDEKEKFIKAMVELGFDEKDIEKYDQAVEIYGDGSALDLKNLIRNALEKCSVPLKEGFVKKDEKGQTYCSVDGENWEECSGEEYDELVAGGYKELNEDFQKVEVETDEEKMTMEAGEDGKVTVTTEPKQAEEVIEPADEEPVEAEVAVDEFDFLDESKFDNLINKYAHRVYENIENYETTKINLDKENKLIVEGNIKFKSGTVKPTKFVFEKIEKAENNIKLTGINETFSKSKKAFTISGTVENKNMILESLDYNYRTTTNNQTKTIRGKVVNRKN